MNTIDAVEPCRTCDGEGFVEVVAFGMWLQHLACGDCLKTGLIQIDGSGPAVIPDSCECSENGTCLYRPCVEAYKAEYLHHAPISRDLPELWWLAS